MAEAYGRAFERASLDVRGDKAAVAARIGASDVRPQLVMALDHWAFVDALGDRESMARLLGLARRTDPDPKWGDRFRAPALWGDEEAPRRPAAEAQERLASEAPKSGPPAPLVALLAKQLGQRDEKAEPLLRAAQSRHPEDFWLNHALGKALRERKPAESVGFYRAALATRPTVAAGPPWDEREFVMYAPAPKSPYGERRSSFGKERYSALGIAREDWEARWPRLQAMPLMLPEPPGTLPCASEMGRASTCGPGSWRQAQS